MIANRSFKQGAMIGLDIGSFAVRAAEVSHDGGTSALHPRRVLASKERNS